MRKSHSVILFALLLALTGLLHGQNTRATLVGTVTDPSGAVIAGANVVVTNEGTGSSVTTKSDEAGDYVVANLPAATYKIRVEFAGFQTADVTGVQLLLASTVRANVRLQPGRIEQSVEVTAAPPTITSDSSSVANVIDNHGVATLPVNGRMIDRFIQIAPGNTSDSASNPKIGGTLHLGGSFFTVDGVATNDPGNGGAAYSYKTQLSSFPSVDTIQEFRIESNNAKAEYEGVANISMITKSGGNDFHGSLFEFNRNRQMAAKEFFALIKPAFNRNEFGGTLGGRIIRNKLFFFGSYEGLRQRSPTTNTISVGTAAMRAGNFNGLAALKDPLNNNAPFPDNQIPTGRLDPRIQKVLTTYVPLPNLGGTGNNYALSMGNVFDVNRENVKVDYSLTPKDVFTFTASYNKGSPYFVANGTPATYGNFSDGGYITDSASASYTRTLSPRTLNEFRLGYLDHRSIRMGQNLDFNPSTLFPTLYPNLPVGGLPTFNVTGFNPISDTGGSGRGHTIMRQVTDNFSFVRGAHTFKAGFDMSHMKIVSNAGASAPQFGTFTFQARYTGNAYADFVLGYPTDTMRAVPSANVRPHNTRYGAYFQDDWRVSRKLTINLGIRYSLFTVLEESNQVMAGVDLATGKLVVQSKNGGQISNQAIARTLTAYPWVTSESMGWGSSLMNGDHNNFGPRFGFAYRPFDSNKTVVRGGYGIFYSMVGVFAGPYRLINGSPIFGLTETYASGATSPTITLADPFPGAGAISANPNATAVNKDMTAPYSQQWNFTIEQEFAPNTSLRLTYLGNKTNNAIQYNFEGNYPYPMVPGNLQANRPFQPWASIGTMDTHGNAFTNQLQVEVMRHYTKGLLVQANFTWNKSIDNVPVSNTMQNPYDFRAERGSAEMVRNKVFYGAATYDLPFGPGKKWANVSGWAGKLIGGWSTATITQFRSGQPFNVTFSDATAGWWANRADVVSSQLYPAQRSIAQWFNTAAFAKPRPFTFGNSARSLLFGPGQKVIDFSLLKNTAINDRFNLQFRAEAFNMPNTPSFGLPASVLTTTSNFGKISSTSVSARTIQFGLKLLF